MTLAEELGAFVATARPDAAVHDALALHLIDGVAALGAGEDVPESRALTGEIAAPVVRRAATLRCTELDDIHMAACVTPGAIVVPVLFDAMGAVPTAARALEVHAAALVGYEVAIRLGIAIGGPRLLARGLWPSALVAPFAAAATQARLLGLDAERAAHALAVAGTRAVGTVGRAPGLTSRWLVFGLGVQDGVLAAHAAAAGFRGELALLDGGWSAATGIALDRAACVAELGAAHRFAETSLKPWCAAKQTIAAIAAFRDVLADSVEPAAIREIEVGVPAAFRQMIDRAAPRERLEALASVQHRLACAAFAPERLLDAAAGAGAGDPRFAALAAAVRVVSDDALDAHYPARWPARVCVVTEDGMRRSQTVVDAPGDPRTGFGAFDDLRAKYPGRFPGEG